MASVDGRVGSLPSVEAARAGPASGRTWLRSAMLAAAMAGACTTTSDERAAPELTPFAGHGAQHSIPIDQGTNVAATIAPDRASLVIELHGALFSVPAGGGRAARLTPEWLEPSRPDHSPRGDLVAFQAYAGGTFHIWVMAPDGSGLRQLTTGHGDDREPRVSPDGTRIAFASDRAFEGSYDIWVVEIETGALTRWTSSPADELEPAWVPSPAAMSENASTDEIAFVSGTGAFGTSIEAAHVLGHPRTLARTSSGTRIAAPSPSPDGKRLAYVRFDGQQIPRTARLMVDDESVGPFDDVFPFTPVWLDDDELLYTANGGVRATSLESGATRTIPFEASFDLGGPRAYARKRYAFDDVTSRPVQGIVSPALSPDGKGVVFEALNQLWQMPLDGSPRPLTHDGYFKVDPAFSPDGGRIVYGCDRSGTMDLWLLDVTTGNERRLTTLPGAEVAPAWSPNGRTIAFQDQTGATSTVDVGTGRIAHLDGPRFAPGRPSWSPDGKRIALAALKPYGRRFREGTNQILTIDVATKAATWTEPAPFASISTRGDDGPVYAPDGSAMAYVMEGVLWLHPVDEDGRPTGNATRIGNEPADAPTWSRDGKHLLYLSNGSLRLLDLSAPYIATIPVPLEWAPEPPARLMLIHAGKLWDGTGPHMASDVDLLVAHGRVASITPHRADAQQHALALGARYVDAANQTIVPGLWESHTHHLISGKYFGDRLGRLWLAYGVTSLFSMGDPAYRALETREAYGSGARLGPRFFATGEALDGERTYYSVMRPIRDPSQLPLELSRAGALGYDMLKTYVRMPAAWQVEVTRAAHDQLGIWTGSHYMLPGLAGGVDAMTHISATTRTGYAYTRSGTGSAYADVPALLAGGGMFVMSTPFESSTLYADDPRMLDDPRLLALSPPWDLRARHAELHRLLTSDRTSASRWLAHEVEIVDRIVASGGLVLAGSDSPLDEVATALHMNVRAQVKYGREPWQALQTATLFPAKAFGLERDLGTLEPGKLADLVLVGGDPLADITALTNVTAVMRGGHLYTTPELVAPFAAHAD